MAESVDALVSNTNDCNGRAGSTPAPGTNKRCSSDFRGAFLVLWGLDTG